ncbi:MAG: ribosome silencing factor [Gammaproteobacteria bacterium]|nr:ribosome silencing factor [Gammaproteobacteria bacterium]
MPKESESPILTAILHLLDDNQAIDVNCMNVYKQTTITDYMIVCSGRSSRHVKSIAENTREQMKKKGFTVLGESGLQTAEWILLDFGEVIVHVMQPSARAFYHLEGLWQSQAS